MEFSNPICAFSSDYQLYNFTSLKKLDTNRYALNLLVKFKRELPASTDLQILITFRNQNSNKTIRFVDLKLNLCKTITHVKLVPLINNILIRVTQSSNIPMECPIQAVSFTCKCIRTARKKSGNKIYS